MTQLTKPQRKEEVRVLLADVCPLVLQGLNKLLACTDKACTDKIRVVGQTSDLNDIMRLTIALSPEVILLDPNLEAQVFVPLQEGKVLIANMANFVEDLRELTKLSRIVAYSASNTTASLMILRLAGVAGYIYKGTPFDHLDLDLGTACASRRPPWRLGLDTEEAQRRLLIAARTECLSQSEKKILFLLLKGFDNTQIAQTLYISSHTVKKHVSNTLRKLGYNKRKELLQD